MADTAAQVASDAAALPCTTGAVQTYTDPVFTGHIVELTNCGGTMTRVYVVVANPSDRSMTAELMVQVTDSDDGDVQTVLSSFNVAPAATDPTSSGPTPSDSPAPTSSAPTTMAVSVVPTSTAGVFTPPVEFPDDTVAIVDDSGLLVVGVPPSWTERITAPRADAEGSGQSYIAASPDLDTFLHDPLVGDDPFTTPGVVYVGLPFTEDTAGVLTQLADGQACTPGPVQAYADSEFSGHIQEFTACGGLRPGSSSW